MRDTMSVMKQFSEGMHSAHVHLYSVFASRYKLIIEGGFVDDLGRAVNTIAAGAVYVVVFSVFFVFVMFAALMVVNILIGIFGEVGIVAHFLCGYYFFFEWYVRYRASYLPMGFQVKLRYSPWLFGSKGMKV